MKEDQTTLFYHFPPPLQTKVFPPPPLYRRKHYQELIGIVPTPIMRMSHKQDKQMTRLGGEKNGETKKCRD